MTRWRVNAGVDKAGRLAKTVPAEDHCTVMFTSECARYFGGPGAQEQVHIHCLYHLHFCCTTSALCGALWVLWTEHKSLTAQHCILLKIMHFCWWPFVQTLVVMAFVQTLMGSNGHWPNACNESWRCALTCLGKLNL